MFRNLLLVPQMLHLSLNVTLLKIVKALVERLNTAWTFRSKDTDKPIK